MPNLSEPARRRDDYWVRTGRLTLQLMLAWFGATFGVIFFARELSVFTFFGWPLTYYLVAQGTVLLYCAIILIYACKMRALDKSFENGDHDVN